MSPSITPAPGIRPGHYVNGRHYSLAHRAQAVARAEFLAREYGRTVYVATRRDIGGDVAVTHTAASNPAGAALINAIGA